jgi:hypothetical protein
LPLRCLLHVKIGLDIEGLPQVHLILSQIELWDHQDVSRNRAVSSRTLCQSEMPSPQSELCEGPKGIPIFQSEYKRLCCLSSSSKLKILSLYLVQSLTFNKLGRGYDRFDQSLTRVLRNKLNRFLDSFLP